ncbi:hypothetical protein [Colwellia sp. Arc7-D]|uniref:COG4705 family protein n=1 Tax=Colwellia sp. Arc7-D TaxID=2161872 RepID=UPI000D36C22E|nr:hypothetical protein [Colwellia sp. Arc7-D]AWB57230.1 hypothetical protein DBO93_06505 [Colwellia sp. Arc7-D]
MNNIIKENLIKVPQITLGFWVIKVLATTLGETGGDAVSMSMNFGYLLGTIIFMLLFVLAVTFQVRASKFHPSLYWMTIIASTTVGTTLADFADRSLGIGYLGGTILLASLLMTTLFVWFKTTGSISVSSIDNAKSESFYWITIMFSQTLGTALGDWTADYGNLGYVNAAYIFASMLLVVVVLYFATKVSRTILFWSAFVLTRPLGAVIGDYLDKPVAQGGLEFSRYGASLTLLAIIILLIIAIPQRPADKQH